MPAAPAEPETQASVASEDVVMTDASKDASIAMSIECDNFDLGLSVSRAAGTEVAPSASTPASSVHGADEGAPSG